VTQPSGLEARKKQTNKQTRTMELHCFTTLLCSSGIISLWCFINTKIFQENPQFMNDYIVFLLLYNQYLGEEGNTLTENSF